MTKVKVFYRFNKKSVGSFFLVTLRILSLLAAKSYALKKNSKIEHCDTRILFILGTLAHFRHFSC